MTIKFKNYRVGKKRTDDSGCLKNGNVVSLILIMFLCFNFAFSINSDILQKVYADAPSEVNVPNSSDEGHIIYIVEKGDTITEIAREYGVSKANIIKINDLQTPSIIIPGQELKIPKKDTGNVNSIINNKDANLGSNTTETINNTAADLKASTNNTVSTGIVPKAVSITFKNADLRDILSTLALAMNVNIILAEEPVTASFQIKNTAPRTALDYLLKTLGLEYVESGNLIVVGNSETLQRDFMNQMTLTRFNLKYITSDIISSQIDALGISVKKITLENNEKAIWVQGTPPSLSKVRELISMIDLKENSPDENKTENGINLSSFKLEYVTAQTLDKLIHQMGINSKTLIVDANPRTIWVDAAGQALKDIEQLIQKVDVVDNYAIESTMPLELIPYKLSFVSPEDLNEIIQETGIDVKTIYFKSNPNKIWVDSRSKDILDFEELIVKVDLMENTTWPLNIVTQNLKNITASKFKTIANEIGITTQIITLDSNAHTVWLVGDYRELLDIKSLLKELDNNIVSDGANFFTYHLNYISPSEAVKRFGYLNVEDINVIALEYPFFSKEILVVGPADRKPVITEMLNNIDVSGEKIRVPIDYSNSASGQSRLTSRRDLLVTLTKIPASSFFISNNVSRDDTPLYIMWVEETPENISKIRNMIDTISNP
ncbi:MAG TPA: LysM peptidoglycan-binding domain-containing protein [Clostridiales bacterium]|nr:LysM peptidoglycan-binding domain-containing protein [Clostridiales bacterium]